MVVNFLSFASGVLIVAAFAVGTFAFCAAFAWNDWGFNASAMFHAADLTFWQSVVTGVFITLIRLRPTTGDKKNERN